MKDLDGDRIDFYFDDEAVAMRCLEKGTERMVGAILSPKKARKLARKLIEAADQLDGVEGDDFQLSAARELRDHAQAIGGLGTAYDALKVELDWQREQVKALLVDLGDRRAKAEDTQRAGAVGCRFVRADGQDLEPVLEVAPLSPHQIAELEVARAAEAIRAGLEEARRPLTHDELDGLARRALTVALEVRGEHGDPHGTKAQPVDDGQHYLLSRDWLTLSTRGLSDQAQVTFLLPKGVSLDDRTSTGFDS